MTVINNLNDTSTLSIDITSRVGSQKLYIFGVNVTQLYQYVKLLPNRTRQRMHPQSATPSVNTSISSITIVIGR